MKKKFLTGVVLGLILFGCSCLIVRKMECGVDMCFGGKNGLCLGACFDSKDRGFPYKITKQQVSNGGFENLDTKLVLDNIVINLVFYQIIGLLVIKGLSMPKWGKHNLKKKVVG